jgi:hypothetical protein
VANCITNHAYLKSIVGENIPVKQQAVQSLAYANKKSELELMMLDITDEKQLKVFDDIIR